MKANPRKRPLPLGIGRCIDGIKKQDQRGLLYFMDCRADYYKLEKYVDLIATPGCSSFLAKSGSSFLLGRNYDFCHYKFNEKTLPKDSTGLIIVIKASNPKAKYKSLGIADGFWLDFDKGRYFEGAPSDGKTDMTRLGMAPFVIMDGVNEAGLAASIMHLPTENEWTEIEYRSPDSLDEKEKATAIIYDRPGFRPQRLDSKVKNGALAINTADRLCWRANKNFAVCQNEPGKKSIFHPVLMRKMLDFCADVGEAVELAKAFNVRSPLPDNDYHIMLCDSSGSSVMLEWVNNELRVVPADHGTNFYLSRPDHYGYGYDRDGILNAALLSSPEGMNPARVMQTLEAAAQNPFKNPEAALTQWSAVYDLEKKSLLLSVFLDYENLYSFEL